MINGNCKISFPCYGYSIAKRYTLTPFKRRKPMAKPPTIPPARSKRYRIVEVDWQDPVDVKEVIWKRHAYLNALASIRFQFRKELYEKSALEKSLQAKIEAENSEGRPDNFADEIEDHNKMQALKRTERIKNDANNIETLMLTVLEKHIRLNEEEKSQREKIVLDLIGQSTGFVTPENADEKISAALEEIVEYNYAIDLDGNVYKGHKHKRYLEESYMINQRVSGESAPALKTDKLEIHKDDRVSVDP